MALARALRREGLTLEGKRILEDGCGEGNFLRELVEFGAEPRRAVGLDIKLADLKTAASRTPASFVAGDARALPFRDGSFDVVVQSVLFSSLAPGEDRRRAAQEISRTLTTNGILIWYDFVEKAKAGLPRGLELDEVRDMFPGWRLAAYKFGLRFKWALALVNKSLCLSHLLAALGIARSHYVIIMRRP